MNIESSQARTDASQRWDSIDAARGIALGAMIVYHFGWDLSFLNLIETNILQIPAWRWFARAIAGAFLILAGFGLALAHAHGFRRPPFLRRLMKIGGAALAVTLATFLAFPQSYIFFGILHCIALSSLLALPFLKLHPVLVLAFAMFCLAAPRLFTSPAFDMWWLDWLGLGSSEPVTNDYVPIFPWFGFVLIGVAAGRLLLARRMTLGLARWSATGRFGKTLILAGRKSLPIYLIHQPVLLAILYGALHIAGPNPAAEARPFMSECIASCLRQNARPQTCRDVCSCTVATMRQGDLWAKLLGDRLDAEDQTRISQTAQQCLRRTSPS